MFQTFQPRYRAPIFPIRLLPPSPSTSTKNKSRRPGRVSARLKDVQKAITGSDGLIACSDACVENRTPLSSSRYPEPRLIAVRTVPYNQRPCPNGGHYHVRGSKREQECIASTAGTPLNRKSAAHSGHGIARHRSKRSRAAGTSSRSGPAVPSHTSSTLDRPAQIPPQRIVASPDRKSGTYASRGPAGVSPTSPILPPHRATAKRGHGTARDRAKHSLAVDPLEIDTDLLTFVFDRDGFYERLADRLLDNLPWWRRSRWLRGHWLCTCLNDLARGVDPGTYAEQIQKPVRDGLAALGFPKFIANVLGASGGLVRKIALGHTPITHLASVLRVLIALVCPNLDRCPTKPDVVKTFATPALAEYLKKMTDESTRSHTV